MIKSESKCIYDVYHKYMCQISDITCISEKNVFNVKCFSSTDWACLNAFCDSEDWSNRC